MVFDASKDAMPENTIIAIKSAKLDKNNMKDHFYTGALVEIDPSELIVMAGGARLTSDDFEIIGYSNNVKKGTAKVTIRGKGKYSGVKTISFKIKATKIKK